MPFQRIFGIKDIKFILQHNNRAYSVSIVHL